MTVGWWMCAGEGGTVEVARVETMEMAAATTEARVARAGWARARAEKEEEEEEDEEKEKSRRQEDRGSTRSSCKKRRQEQRVGHIAKSCDWSRFTPCF